MITIAASKIGGNKFQSNAMIPPRIGSNTKQQDAAKMANSTFVHVLISSSFESNFQFQYNSCNLCEKRKAQLLRHLSKSLIEFPQHIVELGICFFQRF